LSTIDFDDERRRRDRQRDDIKRALSDPGRVAELLGLTEGSKRQQTGLLVRCPSHNERDASCSITRHPADDLLRVKCHACGFSGDVFHLVAAVRGLAVDRDFAAVVEEARRLAGIAELSAPQRPSAQASTPDLDAAWAALPQLDAAGREYLRGRGLDGAAEYCRTVPQVAPAQLGQLAREGFVLAQAMRNSAGRVVGIQVRPVDRKDFRVVGQSGAGVFGQVDRVEAARVVVLCEGFTDTLAALCALDASKPSAVIGIAGVNAVSALHGLPLDGKKVLVATDADTAGDKGAAAIAAELDRLKASPVRARPTAGKDLCDMLGLGQDLRAFFRGAARVDTGFRPVSERLATEREARLAEAGTNLDIGLPYLDAAVGGVGPGDVLVIGAHTGAGKTETAANMAAANAAARRRVFYFALEAEPWEIERRLKYKMLVSSVKGHPQFSRMNYLDWRAGRLDDLTGRYERAAEDALAKRYETLQTFYRAKEFTGSRLRAIADEIREEADLIIIDHLHYIDNTDDNENRGVKRIVMQIRDIALDTGRPVALIAHLRKRDRRNAPLVPDISDFHGSSEIGKVATKAVILAPAYEQPKLLDGKGNPKNWIWPTYVRVVKCRQDGSRTRFCGLMWFDGIATNYLPQYDIGRLENDDTKFKLLGQSELPSWAMQAWEWRAERQRSGEAPRQGSFDDKKDDDDDR